MSYIPSFSEPAETRPGSSEVSPDLKTAKPQSSPPKSAKMIQGKTYAISSENFNTITRVVLDKLRSSNSKVPKGTKALLTEFFRENPSVTESAKLKEFISKRLDSAIQITSISINAKSKKLITDAIVEALEINVFPQKRSKLSYPLTSARLQIKERGEIIDRALDMLAVTFKDTLKAHPKLIMELEAKLLGLLTASKDTKSILDGITIILIDNIPSSDKSKLKSQIDKMMQKLSKYRVVPEKIAPSAIPKLVQKSLDSVVLEEKYSLDTSEKIPDHILKFDVEGKHIMKPANYLDVRLARAASQMMIYVTTSLDKNMEMFIGPESEMKTFYQNHGYLMVAELKGQTSNRYFYFEKPANPNDAIMVVTGSSNSSKLFHQLLQLKFVGINLEQVQIRGNFKNYLSSQLDQLDKQLAVHSLKPEVAFIGNRSQIVTQLAWRLFPKEMKLQIENSVGKLEEKDVIAQRILDDNKIEISTHKVGGFSYSYIKVPKQEGGYIGIIGMRMPNGSLSYDASKLLFKHGVRKLFMVGAGGSLDGHKSILSSCQILTSSIYQEKDPITVPQKDIMKVQFTAFRPIPNCSNITVDSPLEENYTWFDRAEDRKVTSVDVESFHILRAYKEQEGNEVQIFPGIFTSDVVEKEGEHTLEEKIDSDNAWLHFPEFLQDSFDYLAIDKDIINKT